jgi:RNase H-like domain found in reverse transcriptase
MQDGCQWRSRLGNRKERKEGTRSLRKSASLCYLVLQTFRQHLYGERFGVVTDHSTLDWLMSLRDTKHRLARWILEFQSFDFDVEHVPGNGSIMVIPDALSRDTMDKDLTLCA